MNGKPSSESAGAMSRSAELLTTLAQYLRNKTIREVGDVYLATIQEHGKTDLIVHAFRTIFAYHMRKQDKERILSSYAEFLGDRQDIKNVLALTDILNKSVTTAFPEISLVQQGDALPVAQTATSADSVVESTVVAPETQTPDALYDQARLEAISATIAKNLMANFYAVDLQKEMVISGRTNPESPLFFFAGEKFLPIFTSIIRHIIQHPPVGKGKRPIDQLVAGSIPDKPKKIKADADFGQIQTDIARDLQNGFFEAQGKTAQRGVVELKKAVVDAIDLLDAPATAERSSALLSDLHKQAKAANLRLGKGFQFSILADFTNPDLRLDDLPSRRTVAKEELTGVVKQREREAIVHKGELFADQIQFQKLSAAVVKTGELSDFVLGFLLFYTEPDFSIEPFLKATQVMRTAKRDDYMAYVYEEFSHQLLANTNMLIGQITQFNQKTAGNISPLQPNNPYDTLWQHITSLAETIQCLLIKEYPENFQRAGQSFDLASSRCITDWVKRDIFADLADVILEINRLRQLPELTEEISKSTSDEKRAPYLRQDRRAREQRERSGSKQIARHELVRDVRATAPEMLKECLHTIYEQLTGSTRAQHMQMKKDAGVRTFIIERDIK